MVTDRQVRLLRQKRMEGKTQEAAAAAADMSVRTARKWEAGKLPSESKSSRGWRTRPDPFVEVWESVVVPLLVADTEGKLQAKTVLEHLQATQPGEFDDGQLRTLQRRFRDWRALHGPEREVFFEQVHPPGRLGAMDFTDARELGVTVGGVLFVHLLFVFRLAFSGWTFAKLAFSESFEALAAGFQEALWELGGAPGIARTDNLSAATHELKKARGRGFNARYRAVLDHYGVQPARIEPGKSNQNGVAEKAHHLLKSRLEQALQLRGSRDFTSPEAWLSFVREQVAVLNRSAATALEEERRHLLPLPPQPVPSHTIFHPRVRRWSTIRVAGRTYSVPSRLIGHQVEARQHADTIEVFYKGKLVERLPRVRKDAGSHIDYRHVIWSLVRKPGAFALYRFRDALFPTPTFRAAYGALKSWRGDRADIEYVRVLHLAASTLESAVEQALRELLAAGDPFDYVEVKRRAAPEPASVPTVRIAEPDLAAYDGLLGVSA